jgi:hypothetical protein
MKIKMIQTQTCSLSMLARTRLLVVVALGLVAPGRALQAAEAAGAGFYNVRSFGAAGDGKTLDSPAINKAIESCAAAGGGTVYLPAGAYLSGSLRLKSNIHLLLDAGATLVAAPLDMNAYDPAEPFELPAYQDGGHTFFHNSLIWGENLTNVSITGQGAINGAAMPTAPALINRIIGSDGLGPRHAAQPRPSDINALRLGNKSIALKLCRGVLVRDLTILHGGHFAILATGCDGMTLDNLTIDTDRDGIDIDCCRNTTVSNCRINSPDDDALVPKSSFALGRNVITENLTIINCQVSGFEEGTLVDGTMAAIRPYQIWNGSQWRLPQRDRGQLHLSLLPRLGPRGSGWWDYGEHHDQQHRHDGCRGLSHLSHVGQPQSRAERHHPQQDEKYSHLEPHRHRD